MRKRFVIIWLPIVLCRALWNNIAVRLAERRQRYVVGDTLLDRIRERWG